MSYQSQAQLEADYWFQQRDRAANLEQSDYFINAAGLDQKALAEAVMRDEPGPSSTLVRLAAAAPGIADKVDNGDGTIDSAKVTDADLLSLTQANWPTVAGLYFTTDGTPKP